MTANARTLYLDVAKGIGIVLVVIFHVWRGIVEAGLGLDTPVFQFADYFVYIFHMPLFFVIAGAFVDASLAKGTVKFVKDKIVYVYYPYLIWSVISIFIAALLGGYVNKGVDFERILSVPLFPKFHYWFLFTLMIYYLMSAVIRDVRLLVAIAVGATLAQALGITPDAIERYLHFYLFFVIGILVASRLSRFDLRYWPVALLILVVCAFAGRAQNITELSPWLVPAGFAGCYGTLALAKALGQGRVAAAFQYLGQQSLAIYLLHILAASGTRIILTHLVSGLDPYLLLIVSIANGIILPLLAFRIASLLGVLTISGLGKDRRQLQAVPSSVSA